MSFLNQFLISIVVTFFFAAPNATTDSPLALDGGCIEVNYQWVVTNTSPKPFNASAATAGSCSGNYSYQWQMSYDNTSFFDIPGAISQNLTYGGTINQTTYFHRRTKCGAETKYTNAVEVKTAAQVYYNTIRTGSFTKNNCPYPNYSAPIPYTVPAQKYSATDSAGAQNAATNDYNSVGQWNANVMGTCCSLTATWASGVMIANYNFSLSGSTVSYTIAMGWPGGSTTSMNLGTLNGNCLKPTATRTVNFSAGSATFQFVVTAAGAMSVNKVSGTISPGYIPCIGNYNK